MCGNSSRAYAAKQRQGRIWTIWRCDNRACRHGFVWPRPGLTELTDVNQAESVASDLGLPTPTSAMSRRDVRITVELVTRVRGKAKGGRMLDVGAGDGSFSAGLSTAGYRAHMIDLDQRCGRAVETVPGASFALETFEGLSDRGPYELILMSQVLEHALDPADWLGRARGLLAPGGMVVVLLPNFGGIYRLLGSRDPYLIPPVHVNFFTPGSLERAMVSAGLVVRSMDSDSWIGGGGGMAKRVAAGLVSVVRGVVDPRAMGIILRGVGGVGGVT